MATAERTANASTTMIAANRGRRKMILGFTGSVEVNWTLLLSFVLIKEFNGILRAECLNANWFLSLRTAPS
jgi:hypothetical protein